MAEESDKDQKTEDPTDKRLSDARSKGQVPTSREVSTALLFLAAVGLFFFQGAALWNSLLGQMRFFISGAIHADFTQPGVVFLVQEVLKGIMVDLAPFFLVFLIIAVAGSLLQHGWLLTFDPIIPRFSKLNPWEGIKRLFSTRSLVELGKSLLKMALISWVVYTSMVDSTMQVLGLAATTIQEVLDLLSRETLGVLWRVALTFVVLGVLDFAYQKFEYIKNLRMTKQEVRDEYKQMEGDPQIKARIRQMQREAAQRRMMQEVPKADVVITNPTHFAVALRYVPGEMTAPKVVAKGRGLIAERIRELAREHGVPLVENPPLARTLFREVNLDTAIPGNLFKAVAEVLAYVYRLRRRKR